MNQRRTVVVHGASGTQGGPVARRLHERGWHVTGLARDASRLPTDIRPVAADLADRESLATAYSGADAVVVQLPLEFDPAAIDAQVDNVLHALGQAGVGRVVFNASSPLPAKAIGIPFVDGRVRLATALPDAVATASVVGPASAYMENLAISTSARRLRDRGELAYPLPSDFAMPWLALDDLASVVADVLDDPRPAGRRVVVGPEALTGPQSAERLTRALGRPVTWVRIDHREYESMLVPDLGPAAAAGIASFYALPPRAGAEVEGLVTGATALHTWAVARMGTTT